MGDQQRAGSRVEECACQTRQRLGPLYPTGRRVAGRQDDPIGIELEGRNLGCREVSVVALGRRVGRRQKQPRLGVAADLTSKRTMGGEVDDAILGQLTCFAQTLDSRAPDRASTACRSRPI
jgi:hypothetical protein